MRTPDSIQILLRVRSQREELEERKLTAIIRNLKLAEVELGDLSRELDGVTTARVDEIQYVLPNTHHQAVEAQSRTLWERCADRRAGIQSLKQAQAQQMSAFLLAHREREVIEELNKRRNDVLEAEQRRREQRVNDDLFLARRVAKWDMLP
jgi:flagellar export protein FliJ